MLKFALRTSLSLLVSVMLVVPANALSSFNFDHNKSVTLKGRQSHEQFGTDIASSDLNRDGFLDLIVSSPYFSSNGKEKRGKVEVFFGPINQAVEKSDFQILGAQANDLLGTSIDTGDINGDGIDDILIGAYQAKVRDGYRPGAVYLFLGKKHRFLQTYDLAVYQPDLSIFGPHHNSYFGSSILAVDMNSDNDLDIVIGAPLSQNPDGVVTGNVYTIFWQNMFNTKPFYDLSTNAPNQLIIGQEKGSLFGSVLKDGYFDSKPNVDLLVSAYAASTNGKVENGAVYLFSNFDQRTKQRKIPTLIFNGEENYSWFGFSLNVGNLNNDRFDDMFISAFPYKQTLKTGKVWAVFGTGLFDFADVFNREKLSESKHLIIKGGINNYMLGNSVIVDDLNKDSISELIIAEPNISLSPGAKSLLSIYQSTNSLWQSKSLSTLEDEPYLKLTSQFTNDWFGHKVIAADMNRDGQKDLVVAAPYRDNMFINDSGAVNIFFLQKDAPKIVTAQKSPKKDKLENEYLTRGEVVTRVVNRFNLKETYSEFIDSCYQNLEFCLFVFSSQSKFDGITFEPEVKLYPDLEPLHPNYEEVTIATMLGLINGNISEAQSPFKPDLEISRIQALKMINEAAALERSNFFSNIIQDMGGEEALSKFSKLFDDVFEDASHMWWYPRYINFANKIGVLKREKNFRPDDSITVEEFNEIMDNFYNFAR